jgi:UBX domain-containing protein 1/4
VHGAVDWLDKNQDKSLEEIKAEDAENTTVTNIKPDETGEQARSLVCNECGKMFRNTALAEFHASKTYVHYTSISREEALLILPRLSDHTDFSESTEEIAPLTEEQKKAKLEELRIKLAAKRAEGSEQDKLDKKKNDEIRRKATKESQDIREQLQNKERIKEAEQKRKEKRADELARKKILDQISKDKEERKRKAELEKAQRAGNAPPAAPESAPVAAIGQVTSKPASAYTETRLRLQAPSGTVTKSFPVDSTLFEVAYALKEESGVEVQSFTQNFPRKVWDQTDFGVTLKEAGMVPSAALIVK